MWVEPNGKVIILSGVPVDPTQTDVPWFSSAGAQESFFKGFTLKSYSKVSFMRVNTAIPRRMGENTNSPREESTIRVPTNAAELYTANYLMFQNTSYSSKWFYAFVETVNPLSDNATEITYQIDDMQTWQFDFEIGACRLEREHIAKSDDKIGANVVPEPLECPKVFGVTLTIDCMGTTPEIYAVTSLDKTGTSGSNVTYAWDHFGVPVQVVPSFPATTPAAARSYLNDFIESKAYYGICEVRIGGICTCAEGGDTHTISLSSLQIPLSNGKTISEIKNKKLCTSQFMTIEIISPTNSTMEYLPEGFRDSEACKFIVKRAGYPWAYSVTPNGYFQAVDTSATAYTLCVDTSVSVPFGGNTATIDAGISAIKGLISIASSSVAGYAYGGAIGAGVAAAGALGSSITSGISKATSENRVKANVGDPVSLILNQITVNDLNPHIGLNSIPYPLLKEYDQFLTYYGYATDDIKVPNGLYSNKRSVFNYVKTVDCMFKSCKCPADSASNIKKIFDKGVRLWHDTSKIGTVVTDNS